MKREDDITLKRDNTNVVIKPSTVPFKYNPTIGWEEYRKGNFTNPHSQKYAESISGRVETLPIEFDLLTLGLPTIVKKLIKSGTKAFAKKKFKSEIDWAKWNPEIPQNKPLVKEYDDIEFTTKSDGTWMKELDGTPFKGTPEQFVQQHSKNFKKAFDDNWESVYRGTNHTQDKTLTDKDGFSVFTADKNLAQSYVDKVSDWNIDKDPLLQLYKRKSNNSIELDTGGAYYNDIDPRRVKSSNIQLSDKLFNELPVFNKSITGHPEYFTDDIAKYVEDSNLDYITLRNIRDNDLGTDYIVNHKPGNYLKSMIGNNGMFDMNDPNIFKVAIPGVAGSTILGNEMKNNKQIPSYKCGGKKKVPAHAFGIDDALGIASLLGTGMQGFHQNSAAPGEIATQSDMQIAGGALSGAAQGATAGLTIGGPIGAGVGALVGGVASLFGAKKRNEQIRKHNQRVRTQRSTDGGLDIQAGLEADYYGDNPMTYTFANGGIMPMDLAYVDNDEILRDTSGNLAQVPNTENGTDEHLINASQLESVLSDKLKVPGTKKTFAQAGEKVMRTYKPSKGNDRFAENTNKLNKISANNAYDNLLAEQEEVKIKKGITPKMKDIPAYENGKSTRRKTLEVAEDVEYEKVPKNSIPTLGPLVGPLYTNHMWDLRHNLSVSDYYRRGSIAPLENAEFNRYSDLQSNIRVPKFGNLNPNEWRFPDSSAAGGVYRDIYDGTNSPNAYDRDLRQGFIGRLPYIAPATRTTNSTPTAVTPVTTEQTTGNTTPKPTVTKSAIPTESGTRTTTSVPSTSKLQAPRSTLVGSNVIGVNDALPTSRYTPFATSKPELPKGKYVDTSAADRSKFGPDPGATGSGFNWGSLASLAPTMYNWIQGMQAPEQEALISNPYSGQIRRTMVNRRFNIDPMLEANRTSRAIANYNANNVNPNSGMNLALRTQMAADEYRANADLYAQKQNADNQYAADYANTLNNLGTQYQTQRQYQEDVNARNRAAARNYTASAAGQFGNWAQVQQQMNNQQSRDDMMWPMITNWLSQYIPSDQMAAINKNYQRSRRNG